MPQCPIQSNFELETNPARGDLNLSLQSRAQGYLPPPFSSHQPTHPAMVYLPKDIHYLIVQNSSEATLAALASVSHEYWCIACPILWRDLPSAVPLLALLDQRDKEGRIRRRRRPIPSEEVSTNSVA